ncbi:MAG TPA: 6-bladed beta-propeller [Pyrinomonadaceae bacterium]|jgi:DNA-binding beta-propeller fold protein YncE/heme-degrading monooxygenase HmoA
MKSNFVWRLVVSCVVVSCLPVILLAQEYRFERAIGRPPTIGEPYGLTVDRAGNMYVADRTNGKVITVRPSGQIDTQRFRAATNMGRPGAVTIDREGNLLVLDEERGAINRFSSQGAQMRGVNVPASRAVGEPSALAGMAVDPQGNVYVSDQRNNVIQKLDPQGRPLNTFGQKGSEPGSFLGPRGLATDAQGNLYVADEFNSRIQKFDGSGRLLATSSPRTLGITISEGMGPMSVAVDSKGNIWVAAHIMLAAYKLDPNFNLLVRLETFGRRNGELTGPVAVAVDAADNVYILDRSRRIQKFGPDGSFISKFAFPPPKLGEFTAPVGLLVDSEGNLFVCDVPNSRIQKFDRNGRALLSFGQFGQGDGEFNGVESLSADRAGNLYVVDSFNHRVQKFDRNGKFLMKWGAFGSHPGEFNRTKVVHVDLPRDIVYVNDWNNARVQKFDLNGKYLGEFGNTGAQETRVTGPSGLAVDKEGNVYVSSWYNNVVQKFDRNGKFQMTIGSHGTGDGQFKGPARSTIDGDGNLVVVDWGNNRVQVFDTRGRFLTKFGGYGREQGRFNQPVGVTVDARGTLFVSDATNARVQVFSKSGARGATPKMKKETRGAKRVFGQVAIYDVIPGKTREFEAALRSVREAARAEPAFINQRVLRNVDEITSQYATYAKFADKEAAERSLKQQLEKVRPFCRRDPEVHLTELTAAYFTEGITQRPTGMEFGAQLVGQNAHIGLFIPQPRYRLQYDDVLHQTKILIRDRKPTGYIGEDVMLETELLTPERQSPYSPRATEPSKMSINYGEYLTMENAEDSYVARQQSQDPKLITMERTFVSSLQVPTRFYMFQVIDNYSRDEATARNSTRNGRER